MTSSHRTNDFLHSPLRGIFRLKRARSISQTLVPVLGFVAFAPMGCATTIAAKYPHLDRRTVCVLPPEIEQDSTEFVFTENNAPVSGFHPEIVDRVAATARTVFEYDPNADPSNVRYLPAPYDQLECAPVFSMLPSKDADTVPLPDAAVDLLVHERRPEAVPRAVAEKLASCASHNREQLESNQYTMTFNVYVRDDGQSVSALLVESTLGDRPVERCIVEVLRNTQWPTTTATFMATPEPALRRAFVGLAPAAPPFGVRSFFAQPAPNMQPPNVGDRPSGVYRIPPQPQAPPASTPGGLSGPRIFVIPLAPVLAAVAAFGIVYFWSANEAPACASEMNPITWQPYTSCQEYDEIQRLSPQQILQQRQAHIKATQPQQPPAPVPPPATGTRRYPNQTCEDAELDRLEAEKKKICYPKGGYAAICPKDPQRDDAKSIPCSLIKAAIPQRHACKAARQLVQDRCFGGEPNPGHKIAIDQEQNAINNCEALKPINCAPGHPMANL